MMVEADALETVDMGMTAIVGECRNSRGAHNLLKYLDWVFLKPVSRDAQCLYCRPPSDHNIPSLSHAIPIPPSSWRRVGTFFCKMTTLDVLDMYFDKFGMVITDFTKFAHPSLPLLLFLAWQQAGLAACMSLLWGWESFAQWANRNLT